MNAAGRAIHATVCHAAGARGPGGSSMGRSLRPGVVRPVRSVAPAVDGRKLEPEPRAAALDALEAHAALVGLDDLAREGEPEAGAADRALRRPWGAVEALEDPLLLGARDAEAVVADGDADDVVAHPALD